MTKEEAIKRFNELMPRGSYSMELGDYARTTISIMVEVMAEAIEELTIHSSVARAMADNNGKNNPLLAKAQEYCQHGKSVEREYCLACGWEPKPKNSSEMNPEEWDALWKKSGELFL